MLIACNYKAFASFPSIINKEGRANQDASTLDTARTQHDHGANTNNHKHGRYSHTYSLFQLLHLSPECFDTTVILHRAMHTHMYIYDNFVKTPSAEKMGECYGTPIWFERESGSACR